MFKNIFDKKPKSKLEQIGSREDIEKERTKKAARPLKTLGLIVLFIGIVTFFITWNDKWQDAKKQYAAREDKAVVELDMDNFGLWQSVQEERMTTIEKDISSLNTNMSTNLEEGLSKVSQDFNISTTAILNKTQEMYETQMKRYLICKKT